jgi:hypothetical protein
MRRAAQFGLSRKKSKRPIYRQIWSVCSRIVPCMSESHWKWILQLQSSLQVTPALTNICLQPIRDWVFSFMIRPKTVRIRNQKAARVRGWGWGGSQLSVGASGLHATGHSSKV